MYYFKSEYFFFFAGNLPLLESEGSAPIVQYVREDGSVIPEDELQELSPVNLLAAAVNMVHRDGSNENENSENSLDHDPGEFITCFLLLTLPLSSCL